MNDVYEKFCSVNSEYLKENAQLLEKAYYVIRFKGKVILCNSFQKIYYQDIHKTILNDITFAFARRIIPYHLMDQECRVFVVNINNLTEKRIKLWSYINSLIDKGLITIEIHE